MKSKFILHIIFQLLIFFSYGQEMVGFGIGRTFYPYSKFGFKEYTPTVNFDFNCSATEGILVQKINIDLMPTNEIGLKYGFSLLVGVTSKINKPISAHLLVGLIVAGATQQNKDIVFRTQIKPIANIGVMVKPNENKNLTVSLDININRERFIHEKPIHSNDFFDFLPVTPIVSIGYLLK